MSRFPPIARNEMSEAQERIQGGVSDIFATLPTQLQWKNDAGLIFGPYSPLFYTEELSDPWFALAFAVTKQNRFTSREKELCILAVLSQRDAPYLYYAHSIIATAIGFTEIQIQQAFQGDLPEELNEREHAIFKLSLVLTNLRQPMEDEPFKHFEAVLGRDGIAGIAHLVSGYVYVAILANISDSVVPGGKETLLAPFKDSGSPS